jgi:hypothetical protein
MVRTKPLGPLMTLGNMRWGENGISSIRRGGPIMNGFKLGILPLVFMVGLSDGAHGQAYVLPRV